MHTTGGGCKGTMCQCVNRRHPCTHMQVFPFLLFYLYSDTISLLTQTQATESRHAEDSRSPPDLLYKSPRPVLTASCDGAVTLRLMATARGKEASLACRVETSNNVQWRINGVHRTVCPCLSHAISSTRDFSKACRVLLLK